MSVLFFDFESGEGLKQAKYLGTFYVCCVSEGEGGRDRGSLE